MIPISGGTVNRSEMDQIKSFVQQTLGCRCPDAVFEHTEIERNILTDSGVFLHSRINIGNRLLIYVMEQKGISLNPDDLSSIVQEGTHERYKYGFNRLRLVLAIDESEELHRRVGNMFDKLSVNDDKIHLHIIYKKQLAF